MTKPKQLGKKPVQKTLEQCRTDKRDAARRLEGGAARR